MKREDSKNKSLAELVDDKDLDTYITNIIKHIDVLPDPNGLIEITNEEYLRLINRDRWLSNLEAAGVDNWEGYDVAYDMAVEEDPNFQRPK